MLKRVLSFLLCIILLSFSIIIYTPVSVKADVSIYDRYNKVYDGYDFSDLISKHKSFNFTDKGGTKHAIKFVGGRWMYFFSSGGFIDDDTKLNYFLSWYAYTGYNTANKVGAGLSAMISSKLGSLLTSSTDLLDSALTATTDVEFEYDDDNGLTILSDSVDKLREQLKKQYYDSIGVGVSNPVNTPQFALEKLSFLYEHQEDFISDYNNIKGEKYVFGYIGGNGSDNILLRLNFTNSPDYFYYDSKGKLCAIDSNLSTLYDFTTTVYAYGMYGNYDFMGASSSLFEYRLSYGECGYLGLDFKRSSNNMFFCVPLYYYSDANTPLWFFKSYEALYNYVHGSQNAYLSSKIEQTGEDIKISIDDMNTNISSKMDDLIDSINNKKDGMSADELQNAIDKGLESISGKIDDIGDNTEQTNNKLDDLISIMREQNIILSDILGVTNRIADSVSDDKEDKNYTINDIVPHFNKCFIAVKNMVLFGTSSFDDTGTQSVMSVDNDVGIAVYADDVEDNVKDYHNGILGKFPFSVPYQLYEWLQVLQCEPKTPEFKYNYGYLVGKKDSEETIIQFDLSNYNDWANVSRSFLKLSFTLALAVGVYRKFKGEL